MQRSLPVPRTWRTALAGVVQRLLGVGLPIYAASGGGIPASPLYPVDRSLDAFLSNPWVWACVQAISTDLSGLPIVAERGTGLDRVQTADHWLLQLLEHPHPSTGSRKLRKQFVADLTLGNGYLRVWRTNERPSMLGRIHPGLIQPLVGVDGAEVGYRLTATGQTLGTADVLHAADINVTSDPTLVLGASPIQPLALRLQVDRDAVRQAGRAARRGKLEIILSPRTDGMVLGPEKVDAMVEAYAAAMETGDGIYVPNTGMEATPVSLTARDGEFAAITERTRGEVLAVFSVPETRVGSPAANYGTAKEQSRIYWSTLQARAALIDDELSRLAEPGVRIRHSFAGVDALQIAQTERQARGVIWRREFGLTAAEAAAYEGFVDLPARDVDASGAGAAPPSADGVDEPRAAAAVAGVLRVVAGLYAGGEEADDVERTAAMLLRQQLRAMDLPRADTAAEEAAMVVGASVKIHAQTGGDLVDLRAFGREHAERIVRLAEAA